MNSSNTTVENETLKSHRYVDTFRELAKAIIDGCNEIEISAELGPAVIKIKAVGVVAFLTCISATALSCYYLSKKTIDTIKDEYDKNREEEGCTKRFIEHLGAAACPVAVVTILGPAAAYACLVMISVGGVGVMRSLRKYSLDNSNGKYILKK